MTSSPSITRHAYLLITHQYTFVLETLIRMIDDERNDIYVHVDKKVRESYEDRIRGLVKNAKVFFVKRHKVYWGHVSLVEAEYELFQAAYSHGGYCRYYLISGSDLPIKTQDQIHAFFDSHQSEEFVAFCKNTMDERVVYKWLFPRHLNGLCNSRNWIGRKINKAQDVLTKEYIGFQKRIGYTNRAFPNYTKCGEWVSLTENAVKVLLAYKKKVIKGFRQSNCPDEHYKATIFSCVVNGLIPWPQGCVECLSFYKYPETEIERHHLQDFVEDACNLDAARYIDWRSGILKELTIEDWGSLVESDAVFCRKVADDELARKIFAEFGPKERA